MAEENKKKRFQEEEHEVLIRIAGRDIPGSKKVYPGLTRIKGISWGVSNLLCKKLGFDKNMKISDLKKEDVKRIEDALKSFEASRFMKNRRADLSSGEDKHLTGIDLEMGKEFDIKRLKKIKSYRGNRHSLKLPVRGQRTRSHFRGKGGPMGVKKPKTGKKS